MAVWHECLPRDLVSLVCSYALNDEPEDALLQAAADGNEWGAHWLAREYVITREGLREADGYAVLIGVCEKGHLALAQWLVARFGLELRDVRDEDGDDEDNAFLHACANNHLEVAQWLAKTFGPSIAGVHIRDGRLLRDACKLGHLAVARWLTEAFGLTAADARATYDDGGDALAASCAEGRLAEAQWIVAEFGLTANDARKDCNCALRAACHNGHLAVAKWLVATFGLTEADARAYDNYALQWACRGGHIDVAHWLAGAFGLTAANVDLEDPGRQIVERYWRRASLDQYVAWLLGAQN